MSYGNDRSRAVFALLHFLMFQHKGDSETVREIFEASRLCADWDGKWDRRVEAEIQKTHEHWEERASADENESPAEDALWIVNSLAEVQTMPIRWIWPGYLAEGKLTTLNGEPGHGKSVVSLDWAARVTTGSDFPDGSKNKLPPSKVMLLTVEEDAADTIKPRFEVAGGDVSKFYVVDIGGGDCVFQIERDADRLTRVLKGQNYKLLILDPALDFTHAQQNVDGEVRPVLNRLKRVAEECDLAVICINHLNKKTDLAAMHRVAGARAWTSVARMNFLLGKGEDPDIRHVCPLKMNLSPDDGGSLDYRLRSVSKRMSHRGVFLECSYPKVEWVGRGTTTAEDLNQTQQKQNRDLAEDWLQTFLEPAGTQKNKKSVLAAALAKGFSKRQVERASGKLGVVSELTKTMPPEALWSLRKPAAGENPLLEGISANCATLAREEE